MGPLISEAQGAKVLDYIAKGRAEGARLVTGGERARVQGFEAGVFVQPTVFADVTDTMTIAREEIFGPVMSVLAFDTEDEGVARANSTPYGLAAGVFTRDLARAHRVVARLDAGTTWINAYNLTPVEMPFGGVKASGHRPRERPRRPRPLEPRQVGLRRHRPGRGPVLMPRRVAPGLPLAANTRRRRRRRGTRRSPAP